MVVTICQVFVSVRDRDETEECDRARLRDNVTWVFVTGSHDKWGATKTNCQSVKHYCVAGSLASQHKHTGPQSANDIRDLSGYFKFVKTRWNLPEHRIISSAEWRQGQQTGEMFVETRE